MSDKQFWPRKRIVTGTEKMAKQICMRLL